MSKLRIDNFYSSDSKRTLDTSELICKNNTKFKGDINKCDLIREQCGGEFEGKMNIYDLIAYIKSQKDKQKLKDQGIEMKEDVYGRVNKFVKLLFNDISYEFLKVNLNLL